MDAGGLTREWYSVLAREIFNANYALFKATIDNVTFQPNPQSYINNEHLQYFKFVGRVIGKAICDGQLMDAHFTRLVVCGCVYVCGCICICGCMYDCAGMYCIEYTGTVYIMYTCCVYVCVGICLLRYTCTHSSTSYTHFYHIHLLTCTYRSFYKHILGLSVSYHDLELIEPEYYNSMKQILEFPLDALGLELTFSAENHDFGQVSLCVC